MFGWPLSLSGSGSVGESGRGSPSGGRGSRSWCPGSLEGDMLLADVRWWVDGLGADNCGWELVGIFGRCTPPK